MAIPLPCSSLGAGVRAGHRSAAESGSPRSLRSAREIPRGGLHAQKLFRYSFLRHSEYHPSAAAVWKAPAVISAIVPLKTGNVKWQFSTPRTAVPSISLQKCPLFLFVFLCKITGLSQIFPAEGGGPVRNLRTAFLCAASIVKKYTILPFAFGCHVFFNKESGASNDIFI